MLHLPGSRFLRFFLRIAALQFIRGFVGPCISIPAFLKICAGGHAERARLAAIPLKPIRDSIFWSRRARTSHCSALAIQTAFFLPFAAVFQTPVTLLAVDDRGSSGRSPSGSFSATGRKHSGGGQSWHVHMTAAATRTSPPLTRRSHEPPLHEVRRSWTAVQKRLQVHPAPRRP
jgi:hypothetical protein